MREKGQSYMREMRKTKESVAFEMLLINVLLLIIIGAFAWLAHFVLTDNNSLNAVLRGEFLR